MADNEEDTTTTNRALEGKVEAQQAEIRRLSEQLSTLLDSRRTAVAVAEDPAFSDSPTRHATHAGYDMGPPRCNRDDMSIYAGSEFGSPTRSGVPSSYDPDTFFDDLLTPAQPVDKTKIDDPSATCLQLDDDLYDGAGSYGPSIEDNIASRITKAVTVSPKKETFDKIMKSYMTPGNAKSFCAPRIEDNLWGTLPQAARSADARAQKLQKNLVHGLIPYVNVLQEIQAAAKEQRPVDAAKIARLAVDGIAMCGFVSYEMSMRRRASMKPFISPKYRGICSRSAPPGEYLFGDDLQANLKKVSEAYQVGQKINPGASHQSNKTYTRRRTEPYNQGRSHGFHRDTRERFTDRSDKATAEDRRYSQQGKPFRKFRSSATSTSVRPEQTKN